MNPTPPCPVCAGHELTTLGQRVYRQADMASQSEYMQRRYRVMFEVWQPGSDEFATESVSCNRCGFVFYTPRPTEAELDLKYQFLVEVGQDELQRHPIDGEYNRRRCENLWNIVGPHLKPASRVLDFGGGDGRLMQPFVDAGHRCHVIDYTPTMIDGVTRLGDTLVDAGPQEPFDAITCSHVIEHVVEPFDIIESLRRLLKPDGIFYVEVPMEIWRKPPLLAEPVTHLNFFTHASMQHLLERAGFRVLRCKTDGLHLPGNRTCVVRGLATPAAVPQAPSQHGPQVVRRLLQPRLTTQLWWASKHPGVLARSLWHRVGK